MSKIISRFKKARPVAAAFGVVALLGVIPANAADIVENEAPAPAAPMEVAPVNTWSGPYAGVTLGYGFSGRTRAAFNHISTDGFGGSVFGGLNQQSGSIVYGAEGDLGYDNVDGHHAGENSRLGFNGSVRGRIGFTPSDNILLYGTGGVAAARLKVSDYAGSDSRGVLGYTVGAGMDAAITHNIFGRVEYRYTDYGHSTFNTGSGRQSVEASDNKLSVGVGLKF